MQASLGFMKIFALPCLALSCLASDAGVYLLEILGIYK
jgi:hypothetical protein